MAGSNDGLLEYPVANDCGLSSVIVVVVVDESSFVDICSIDEDERALLLLMHAGSYCKVVRCKAKRVGDVMLPLLKAVIIPICAWRRRISIMQLLNIRCASMIALIFRFI